MFVASYLAFVGCAPAPPRLSFAVEQRILRETTLDDMPEDAAEAGDNVVRVVRKHGACSGAIIGPRHILTAQHCVVLTNGYGELTDKPAVPGDLHVALGGGYLPWGRVGVRRVHACTRGRADVGHDVAVLVVAKEFPATVPRFRVTYEVPSEADVLEASGFGSNHPRRKVPHTDWLVSSVERHAHRGAVTLVDDVSLSVRIASVPGDSGGPIVDVMSGAVASVVSRGVPIDNDATLRKREAPAWVKAVTDGPRLSVCRSTIEAALRE